MKRHVDIAVLALIALAPLVAQAPQGWKMRVDKSTAASDPDAAGLVLRRGNFGKPGAAVKEEKYGHAVAGLHAGRQKQRAERECFAASGRRLFLQARVRPGVLHHRRGVLRLLRVQRSESAQASQQDPSTAPDPKRVPRSRLRWVHTMMHRLTHRACRPTVYPAGPCAGGCSSRRR